MKKIWMIPVAIMLTAPLAMGMSPEVFHSGIKDKTLDTDAPVFTDGDKKLTSDGTNKIKDVQLDKVVTSLYWSAGGVEADETECAAAERVQINSGPYKRTIICTDDDSATIYGDGIMPDSWDVTADITMEVEYIQTAADTNALHGDISIQCVGQGESIGSTWGTEIAIDAAAVSGSGVSDFTTSGAIDTNSGSGVDDCSPGDAIHWRYQVDTTGTTTAMASLHYLGFKMEYTSTIGD